MGKYWDLFLLSIGITPPKEAKRDKWKETREEKRAEKEESMRKYDRSGEHPSDNNSVAPPSDH